MGQREVRMNMKKRGTGHRDPPPGARDHEREEVSGRGRLRLIGLRREECA